MQSTQGISPPSRHAVEFSTFFECRAGDTPKELLSKGIYGKVAVALKGRPYRDTSMVLLAREVVLVRRRRW